MRIVVGIDGGKNGALAVAKGGELKVYNMPQTVSEMAVFFKGLKDLGEVICFFEKVGAFAGEGNEKRFGIIKMIKQVERLRTILELFNIQVVDVASVTWQSRLKLNKEKGLTKTQRKRKYYEWAKVYASKTKFNLKQADAICLLAVGLKMIEDKDPLIGGNNFENLELF